MTQLELIKTRIKPPIKWVGGKTQFLPKIAQLFAKSGRSTLIEPFCGGLSVTLGLRPHRAIVNDLNRDLIQLWIHCRDAEFLHHPVWSFQIDSLDCLCDEESYYKMRKAFNAIPNSLLYYYLLKTCHKGLDRRNKSGNFNTPYGHYDAVNYDYDWAGLSEALSNVEFHNMDWLQFMMGNEAGMRGNDFVFADPPYHGTFDYSSGFDWGEQVNLAEYLGALPCPVIATNAWHDDVIDLYKSNGFIVEKVTRRGGFGEAHEMFATKNI